MALTSVSVAKPSISVNAISNAYCKPATMDPSLVKIVSAGDSQLFGTKISTSTTWSVPARTFQKRRMIAVAKVSKGSVPPSFSLKDQDGRTVNLSKFKGKPVVLYFYPADETPGCTKEACAFRDSYEKFKRAGAEVVGISGDGPESHKAFAKKYRLPFTLLSDEGNKVRKQWGVPGDFFGSLPGRETYVIDKKGVVQLVYNNQFQPEKHVSKGSVPPAFSLKDQDGQTVNLSKFKGKPVVLYFYPADESPGCTKEACAFRDSYEKFKKAGAEVVGISKDSPDSHKAFAKKYRLPFTLLSDEGDKVRKEWGVPGDFFGSLPGRETYVIDKKGVVQLVYNNQFEPEKHIDETLKMLESL